MIEAELPAALDTPELGAAMLRSYPWPRMLDYGCGVDDAVEVHRRVGAGEGWLAVTAALGESLGEAAEAAVAAGRPRTGATAFLRAAACLRLCQTALEEVPAARAAIYARHASLFARAMHEHPTPATAVEVRWNGRQHAAWFFQPARPARTPPPALIVFGGADGWCEAFQPSVASFLDHGLAVCLLELPGQGLARLVHGSHLSDAFPDAISACIDAISARHPVGSWGLLGHSMGGTLALLAASRDARIVACCSNGGSAFPGPGLERYPRVLAKVAAMMGTPPGEALANVGRWDVTASAMDFGGEILLLHGDKDPLVDTQEIVGLSALDRPSPIRLVRWPDGEHCLYSAAASRNGTIARWAASALA